MVDYTPDLIHEDIRDAVRTMCKAFPDEYWMEHDTNHEFPWEFYDAVAKGGWASPCRRSTAVAGWA